MITIIAMLYTAPLTLVGWFFCQGNLGLWVTSTVDDRPEYLPAKQTEQDELDHAAAGHLRDMRATNAAEVDAGPDQHADNPDNPEK
jgi:hypothetical protein